MIRIASFDGDRKGARPFHRIAHYECLAKIPLSRIGQAAHCHQVIGADAPVSGEGKPNEEEGVKEPISCRQAVGKLSRERPGSQLVRGAGRGIRL